MIIHGETINTFINETSSNNFLNIQYYYQKNQGKMSALNNLIKYVSDDSDLLIECDSDDYLTENAIKTISDKYSETNIDNIYALCFLKNDENSNIIGTTFKTENYKSNMFNLYFKDGITGDKSLVFITKIRKLYKYTLEKDENFITEARMYNELDKNYSIICFNKSIMNCEYLSSGYSKNIKELFLQNPYGYYEYFKQLLSFDMKNVLFSKRLYMIKHYILFCYLTKQKNPLRNINGFLNKFLFTILYIPGVIKSSNYTKS